MATQTQLTKPTVADAIEAYKPYGVSAATYNPTFGSDAMSRQEYSYNQGQRDQYTGQANTAQNDYQNALNAWQGYDVFQGQAENKYQTAQERANYEAARDQVARTQTLLNNLPDFEREASQGLTRAQAANLYGVQADRYNTQLSNQNTVQARMADQYSYAQNMANQESQNNFNSQNYELQLKNDLWNTLLSTAMGYNQVAGGHANTIDALSMQNAQMANQAAAQNAQARQAAELANREGALGLHGQMLADFNAQQQYNRENRNAYDDAYARYLTDVDTARTQSTLSADKFNPFSSQGLFSGYQFGGLQNDQNLVNTYNANPDAGFQQWIMNTYGQQAGTQMLKDWGVKSFAADGSW